MHQNTTAPQMVVSLNQTIIIHESKKEISSKADLFAIFCAAYMNMPSPLHLTSPSFLLSLAHFYHNLWQCDIYAKILKRAALKFTVPCQPALFAECTF
jgi:hypothetical protein